MVEERHRDWAQFVSCIGGRPSAFLRWLDAFDNRHYSKIDRLMDKLGFGLNILAEVS